MGDKDQVEFMKVYNEHVRKTVAMNIVGIKLSLEHYITINH